MKAAATSLWVGLFLVVSSARVLALSWQGRSGAAEDERPPGVLDTPWSLTSAPECEGCSPDPDVFRNVTQLITSKGYLCEDHVVQTQDGFLLSLQRIPGRSGNPLRGPLGDQEGAWKDNKDLQKDHSDHGKDEKGPQRGEKDLRRVEEGPQADEKGPRRDEKGPWRDEKGPWRDEKGPRRDEKKPRPVVFLQHGLLSSSADWVDNLANESLGFALADAGFDVWLGNVRGNVYSNRHVKLRPSQAAFWEWSWDEMARYDLPAMLEYVLNQTGAPHLYYAGHSQGSMIALAEFSRNTRLAARVRTFFALAPVATVGYIKGPIHFLSYFTHQIEMLFKIFGVHNFMPNSAIMKLLARTFCASPFRGVCENIVFLFAGYDTSQLNQTRLPVFLSHTPAGTSVRNIVHFAQMVRSGLFSKYDYGSPRQNTLHYNQTTPPLYNVSTMKVPMVVFTGTHDWLADPADVEILLSQIPELRANINYELYNHMDFIWGQGVVKTIYRRIIDTILGDQGAGP